MKRDDDLLRSMLLEFEAQDDHLILFPTFLNMSAKDRDKVGHIQLLCDAGFLVEVNNGVFRMTNSGHDYIQTIRSDTIWKKTKVGAAKVGGMSLGMMKDLAVAYVKQEAAEKLGISL